MKNKLYTNAKSLAILSILSVALAGMLLGVLVVLDVWQSYLTGQTLFTEKLLSLIAGGL
jgi:hypothetical protein